ncbi:MAG: hypothetical protein JWR19_3333 [Pedosphaera sp.]|nr:hypothetical protein [Pedosphaera sp.]
MKGLFAIPVWLVAFSLCAQPSPVPSPLPDANSTTNAYGTNGLPLTPELQFLMQQLQFDIEQLRPLLTASTGGLILSNNVALTNQPNPALPGQQVAPPPTHPLGTNEIILLTTLESVLQDVQGNIQELLPRLDQLAAAGDTNASHSLTPKTNRLAQKISLPQPTPPRSH